MLSDKNVEPTAVAPTHVPNKIVTMYKIPFPAACTKFGTTPDSLIKLPSINIPTNGAHEGISNTTTNVTKIGKIILSVLETSLNCSILIRRSFLVVSILIIGG